MFNANNYNVEFGRRMGELAVMAKFAARDDDEEDNIKGKKDKGSWLSNNAGLLAALGIPAAGLAGYYGMGGQDLYGDVSRVTGYVGGKASELAKYLGSLVGLGGSAASASAGASAGAEPKGAIKDMGDLIQGKGISSDNPYGLNPVSPIDPVALSKENPIPKTVMDPKYLHESKPVPSIGKGK